MQGLATHNATAVHLAEVLARNGVKSHTVAGFDWAEWQFACDSARVRYPTESVRESVVILMRTQEKNYAG